MFVSRYFKCICISLFIDFCCFTIIETNRSNRTPFADCQPNWICRSACHKRQKLLSWQLVSLPRLTNPTCVKTLSEVGVDVFALVDLADFIFGQKRSLSFASFMDASRQTALHACFAGEVGLLRWIYHGIWGEVWPRIMCIEHQESNLSDIIVHNWGCLEIHGFPTKDYQIIIAWHGCVGHHIQSSRTSSKVISFHCSVGHARSFTINSGWTCALDTSRDDGYMLPKNRGELLVHIQLMGWLLD